MMRALRMQSLIYALGLLVIAPSASFAEEDTAEGKKLMGIEAIDAFIAEQDVDKSDDDWKTSLNKPPKVAFDADKTYYWMLKTNTITRGSPRFSVIYSPVRIKFNNSLPK